MKKIFLSLFFFLAVMIAVCAEGMPDLKYKNIGNKEKIYYDSETNIWSKKFDRKNKNYFIKTKGFGDFYDYLDADKNFAFSTNCEYEFIYNDSLIGYSNKDLKFYEITYIAGGLSKRPLSKEEIEKIFPDYKVISLSQFSDKTGSLKIKKNLGDLKIILFNDTDNTFEHFKFSTGNAKINQYSLRGFLTVSKPGMVEFSRFGEHSDLMYIILVR